jgi:type IV secretory pathway VirJ component
VPRRAPRAAGGFRYADKSDLPGRYTRVDARGDTATELVAALDPLLGGEDVIGDVAGALPDLPLIDIPARDAKRLFAVIWSGDGGWRDLDKSIGEILAQRGGAGRGRRLPALFLERAHPDQVATDLARIFAAARKAWNTDEALVIGYSFGAGVLPFAVNRMPDAERKRIALLSLLGLEPNAPFSIEVTGWLGGSDAEAPLVLPELQRFDLSRLQCVYGEDEEDTLCPDPALAKAEIVRFPGGHHFDEDYEKVADAILASAQRRLR